jgi:hypothetical protein
MDGDEEVVEAQVFPQDRTGLLDGLSVVRIVLLADLAVPTVFLLEVEDGPDPLVVIDHQPIGGGHDGAVQVDIDLEDGKLVFQFEDLLEEGRGFGGG